MGTWRVGSTPLDNQTEFFVTNGNDFAYYARYPNVTYQRHRTRVWNWLRRKGSTKAVIVLDIDAVGSQLANHYGLEWKRD